MLRLASIDIGNDSVKAIMGEEEKEWYIPNVVSEIRRDREIKEFEKDIMNGIHISVTSSILAQKHGTFAVGNLARNHYAAKELKSDSKKRDNDQTLIMLLTTLALDAVTSHAFEEKDGVMEASYVLSTGLPILEATTEMRHSFKQKLENTVHEIEFLQTPSIAGQKVRLHIKHALVHIEGVASFIFLNEKNNELSSKPSLLLDIGGLTSDIAVIKGNSVDNNNTKGISEGVSPYLDRIMEQIRQKHDYPIWNRQDLVDIITHPNPEDQNHIYIHGNRTSIVSIVEEELMKLAKKEYELLRNTWRAVPDIRIAYMIGGGAVLLKEYIEKCMLSDKNLPIRFLGENESIWSNVISYSKIVQMWKQNNQEKRLSEHAN